MHTSMGLNQIKTERMKKLALLAPALLVSKLTLANHGIEAIGSAIATMFLIAIGACTIVGIIAAIVVKEKKGFAFLIGFMLTAFLMAIIVIAVIG